MGEKAFIDLIGGLLTGGFGIFLLIVLLLWVILWFLVPFYVYAINRNIRSLLSKNNTTLVNILFTLDVINKKLEGNRETMPAAKAPPAGHGKK
jgi:hypothetical protein